MKTIYIAAVLLLSTTTAQAQRGHVQNAMEEKYGEPGKQQLQGWMNNMTNAKTEPTYTFPVSMTMHVTDYRNGQVRSETDVKYYINAPLQYFGTLGAEDKGRKKKGDEMLMVYDYKNNAMLMLNQTDKTGMAININAFMSGQQIQQRNERINNPQSQTPEPNTDVTCKKTGNKKTIQGYACEEYVCIDHERNRRSEMWVTTQLPIDMARAGARGPMGAYAMTGTTMPGAMMAGKFYKNDVLESSMEVTELNAKANYSVTIADYKMGMQ